MAQKAFQLAFGGTPVDQDFYGDIVSLRVDENTSVANTFRLQLATTLADDGSWNYLDDDRLALFAAVEISQKKGLHTSTSAGDVRANCPVARITDNICRTIPCPQNCQLRFERQCVAKEPGGTGTQRSAS